MHVAMRRLPGRNPVAYLSMLQSLSFPYLLESAGGPQEVTGASYLAAEPFLTMVARGPAIEWHTTGSVQRETGDPLRALQAMLATCAVPYEPGVPPLAGAAVGYFSYDLARQIEQLPEQAVDDLGLPDLCVHFYRWCISVREGDVRLYVRATDDTPAAAAMAEAEADRRATWLAAATTASLTTPLTTPSTVPLSADRASGEAPTALRSAVVHRTFDCTQFEAAVQRALNYIAAGDIFQVNLAQRFTVAPAPTPLALYAGLRQSNPAPFAAYISGSGFHLISSSPERFLKVEPRAGGQWVETRPIKGTRPRGDSMDTARANATHLLGSEKDAAELAMIVDLQRNDLGRVCRFGSVKVTSPRHVEVYPSVVHTVATIEGVLRPDVGIADLLRATLPGGSVTGAPKVRAMEIIEELEPVRRGAYCGSIGYVGFSGEVDLNIAIRTLILANDRAHLYVGGGIVADSSPQAEYAETLVKAQALLRALGIVEGDPQPTGEVAP